MVESKVGLSNGDEKDGQPQPIPGERGYKPDTLKDKVSKAVLKSLRDRSENEPETYWSSLYVWLQVDKEDLEKERLWSDNQHCISPGNEGGQWCFIYPYDIAMTHTEEERITLFFHTKQKCHITDVLDDLVEQGEVKRIFYLGYGGKHPAYRAN